MKFNKQTNEKQRLLELIQRSHENKNFELEALIHSKGIQYDDFVACLKRIKNQKEFKMYPAEEVLNIAFRTDSKYKDIRISIFGKETIKYFCAHGRLKDLGANVKYYYKEKINEDKGKISRVNIEDYDIRFNLKEERQTNEADENVRSLLENWVDTPKYFRYKKSFRFETVDGLFRNDLSIVKDSKSDDQKMTVAEVIKKRLEESVIKPDNESNFREWWTRIKNKSEYTVMVGSQITFHNTLQKSGVLENKPSYEIEVEYLGNQKQQKTISSHDIMVKYIELIGIHLQAIQKSYFVIGNSEMNKVRTNMMVLTGIKGKNVFKASLPLTVEIFNLQQLNNRQYLDSSNHTLRKNFLVTEKADGERNLLYIDPQGEFYFINRMNTIKKVGMKMPDIANSLLDGEYLEGQELYMIFDAYFYQGKPTWKEVFDPRYEVIKQVTDYIKINLNKPSPNVDIKFPMMIGRKIYYRGDVIMKKDNLDEANYDTLIFDACKKILNQVNVSQGGKLEIGHQFSYHVDGLIFIPGDLHVGQDYIGHVVNNFSDSSNWGRTYKWKPPTLNSIDFEIGIFHPSGKSDMNDQYYNGILYRQISLKTNYQSYFHDRYNSQRVLNEGLGVFNGSKPFTPNQPFVGSIDYNNNLVDDTHIAWIPLDSNNNMITEDNIIVQEGDTVEFTYDMTDINPQHRWKAIRGRPGKKANGYHTAINIWRSIHEPITTDMIIGNVPIPASKSYYQSNVVREELYLKEMNKFHNFVKGRLYDHIGKDLKRPHILDMACGKFGDYFKMVNIKPGFILGVDYAQDNINNFNNGAAVRALLAEKDNNMFKKMNTHVMAIWGDCHLPLHTAEAGQDDLNKYYLKVLYGDVDVSDYSKLGKLSGMALQKFDMVSTHFAVHYFFANYDTLTGYINNVHQNLKTNGYFIGTCLDGKTIFNKFKNNKTDILEQYQDPDKVKLIWRIKKDYEDESFPDDEKSLGVPISVDVESINATSNEYLVNFDYFTKLMNEYGFELIDSKLFHEVPNSMLEEFYAENKMQGDILRKKPKVLEYSVLHRWFIFVKKGINEMNDDDMDKDNNSRNNLSPEEENEITKVNFNGSKLTQIKKRDVKQDLKGGSQESESEYKEDLFIEELNLESIKLTDSSELKAESESEFD